MTPRKTKEIQVSDEEKLEHLAEEIRSILSESVFSARMTILEGKHLVGKTISESPLYKKYGKGSGEFIQDLARRLGRPERDIYLCVQFYRKFPEIANACKQLKGKKNDITWAAARRLLEGEKSLEGHICKWEKVERCKICRKIK